MIKNRSCISKQISNKVFLLLICFLFISIKSQIITGMVTNSNKAINFATISLKDSDNNILVFTNTKNSGEYHLKLNSFVKKTTLEVRALGYLTYKAEITLNSQTDKIIKNILLQTDFREIPEVVIKPKDNGIKIKKDTITYDIAKFKDGSERKVEDLLKKLPGIQVSETGKIKYKGKEISKLLLNEDDLFDLNYTVGTKNISADIVEQIQAIENYSDNPLLSGIKADEIALNLKLKKQKSDISGDARIGYGIKDRYDTEINIINLAQKNKNFSTFSFNNIGQNKAPFDYFNFNKSIEEEREKEYHTNSLIMSLSSSNILSSERSNINSNFFGNINHIFKLSSKTNLRIITSLYKDHLKNFFENNTNYTTNSQMINIYQQDNFSIKPSQFNGNYKLTHKISKNSLIELDGKTFYKKINSIDRIILSNSNKNHYTIDNEIIYLNKKVNYTNKINPNTAFQIEGVFANEHNNENSNLKNGIFSNSNQENPSNIQNITTNKKTFSLKENVLGKIKNGRYFISIFQKYSQNNLLTSLETNTLSNSSINDVKYNILESGIVASTIFSIRKFRFSPSINQKYIYFDYLNYLNNLNNSKSSGIFSPTLNLDYFFSKNHNITFNYFYNVTPPDINNLYENFILTSNRTIKKNEQNLELQKNQKISLNYQRNNFQKNYNLSASLIYETTKNNYFQNNFISENVIQTTSFVLPNKTDRYSFDTSIEKKFNSLSSKIRLSYNFFVLNYFNQINNSELRFNKMLSSNYSLYYQSFFQGITNFSNTITINSSNSKTEGKNFNNGYKFLNSTFKILIQPKKKWMFSFSADYFIPDIEKHEKYLFLDAFIRFSPDKRYTISLEGKNLLNKNTYSQTETSDFSTSFFRSGLIDRYLILNASFSF